MSFFFFSTNVENSLHYPTAATCWVTGAHLGGLVDGREKHGF